MSEKEVCEGAVRETDLHHHDAPADAPVPMLHPALWQQLPYVAALVLAIAGVAYTNVSHQPLVGSWEFLALAMAVVCIVTNGLMQRTARPRFISSGRRRCTGLPCWWR